MKIAPYKLLWRILIFSQLALGLIVAAGVSLSSVFDASSIPDALVDVARFFTAYWWLVLLASFAAFFLLSTTLILFNSELAWRGRLSWALLGLFFPFGGVVYWVDCVERSDLSLRHRSTRIASGIIGAYLLLFGVSSILWPDGWLPLAAEIALGVASIVVGLWLLPHAFGLGGLHRHRQPPTADV